MSKKYCVLEENKICDDCLECEYCDLNPDKICDNCARCIDNDADFKAIEIDDIIFEDEEFNEISTKTKKRESDK